MSFSRIESVDGRYRQNDLAFHRINADLFILKLIIFKLCNNKIYFKYQSSYFIINLKLRFDFYYLLLFDEDFNNIKININKY